jgi:hypothetical protein
MNSRRTATAKAKNYCTLATISGEHFNEVLTAYPGVK